MHPIAKKLTQYAQNAVFLDTETTGLDKDSEIIEIAAIDINGEILLNTTVKPTQAFSDSNEAYQVHGIAYSELLHSPSWPQVQDQLLNIIAGRPLLIYNADFDTRLMNQTAYIHQYYEVEYNAVCMMKLYSEWHAAYTQEPKKRHRLIHAAEYCGVTVNNAHRALADCMTTLAIFRHMLANCDKLFDLNSYKQRNKRIKTVANEQGRLFGQTVVITGDLSRPRAEIQQIAADAGCRCTSSVSPKTTILVLGESDMAAPSSKEKRARELQAEGHPIQILSEAEFMALLDE
ncbi:exonuclease domain-containing protein [Neisseria musculi]|uniref:DNA-directed DNA polymerase n=1 Tax=Neisseria musculi TaxID=1815583 RepID=A0A7H1MER4_9NEIS|nr:exonuclease domain-containing protein [Neisseria musculi]QNT60129.1 exonuclease, DNA polymerase III, epsilon subunit family domain protein [Neisseria musculi]